MRPKILFLCTACPFGTSGSGVRTMHVAKLLEKVGPVTMVVATERPWTDEQLAKTRATFNLGAYILYRPAPIRTLADRWRQVFDPKFMNSNGVAVPPEAARQVQDLVDSHDLVWIHTFKLANAFRRFQWPHSVLDVDDYPSRFHASAAPHTPWVIPKFRRWRNAFAWRRRESVWAERFSVVSVCKESDRAHFGGGPRVQVVPNGFEAPVTAPVRTLNATAPCLGMIGDFTYLPNSNGLNWFLQNCWPAVRREIPGARLRLIGKSSDTIARSQPSEGVIGLGYVPDTGAEIATWSAMIVPTRLGGGTHLKVAEGLARRVPIITTQHGARGYTVEHGRHLLIADAADDFTRACCRLLTDPAAGARLSDAGWELFNQRYSWDSIAPAVAATVEAGLAQDRGGLR